MKLRLATRESPLALWQARHVASLLEQSGGDVEVELVPMTTQGDQQLNQPLAAIGGKGLFLKELEQAMADGRADFAVHSLKDVPYELPDGFTLAAVLDRHDPRDALVSPRYASLDELPAGAVVGTSSLRRQAQLLNRRSDLTVRSLRGNVNTRLRKLDDGDYDAIVLATAGLERLAMADRITQRINVEVSLPAVGQGVVAIECREDDDACIAVMRRLHHAPTHRLVTAERSFSEALAGSCQLPMAANATASGDELHLDGLVATADGSRLLRETTLGPMTDPAGLGLALAQSLLKAGADEILDAAR
ncbi:MAG: hydroxymethylbilane synthase [Pseudomonadota bacterium]